MPKVVREIDTLASLVTQAREVSDEVVAQRDRYREDADYWCERAKAAECRLQELDSDMNWGADE
jgi:hypothetical protein